MPVTAPGGPAESKTGCIPNISTARLGLPRSERPLRPGARDMGACLSTPAAAGQADGTNLPDGGKPGPAASPAPSASPGATPVLPLLVSRPPPAGSADDPDAAPCTPSVSGVSALRAGSERSFSGEMRLLTQARGRAARGRERAARGVRGRHAACAGDGPRVPRPPRPRARQRLLVLPPGWWRPRRRARAARRRRPAPAPSAAR
jgi:hypothetical protein